uniref:Candidate secreted effector n=1 Tax=Meloidogyne incognita TaxID=6306 RepID=A0A914LE01_MELIC
MEEIVQSFVDGLITERENDVIKQPQSAVVLEEEGKKDVCEGTEGVEETLEGAVENFVEETLEEAVETALETALDIPVEGALEENPVEETLENFVEGALETALEVPVETPLSPPSAPPAEEEPLLNIQPTICSVTTIEKPIEKENNKIVEENVAENPPIPQQEEQQIVMNNGGDESTNFNNRPFNTTDSFMAAAMGGGLNDDTMDIANFIEQFDEQLNSPPPNNRENVQQVLSNEIVIEKVSAEEVNNKNNNNIPPPRPIKYTNQTAKKTINGGGGGLSFCQFSVTGRKRVNDALKFKPKEEAKPPQQQLLSLSSPRKRPPIFKHVALQRVRVSLPDVEKLFKEPEMDCGQLKKAILELEQKNFGFKQKRT